MFYEQLASLGSIEQLHNIDLTKDEFLRKTVFDTPEKRAVFKSMTGMALMTHIDAHPTKPLTPNWELEGTTDPTPESAWGKLFDFMFKK